MNRVVLAAQAIAMLADTHPDLPRPGSVTFYPKLETGDTHPAPSLFIAVDTLAELEQWHEALPNVEPIESDPRPVGGQIHHRFRGAPYDVLVHVNAIVDA